MGGFLQLIGVKKQEIAKSKVILYKKVLPKLVLSEMEVENGEKLYSNHFVEELEG